MFIFLDWFTFIVLMAYQPSGDNAGSIPVEEQ